MPKAPRKNQYSKCQRCRKDGQKCLPEGRNCAARSCDRCWRQNFQCSANKEKSPGPKARRIPDRNNDQSFSEIEYVQQSSSRSSFVALENEWSHLGDSELLTIFGDLSHAMDCMRVFENTDLHFHNEDLLQELNERIHRLSSAGQHSEAGSLARHVQSALTDVNPPRTPVQWLWFGFDDVYSVHKRLVMMYQNIGAYPSAETIQEDIVRCCWYRQQVPRQDLKLEEEVESLARMYSAFLDRCGGYNFLVGMHRTTLALTRAARLDIEELYRKMDIWESVGEIPGAPHIAADQNACTLLRRLCEMKADLNTEYNEDTPLHIAASNGSYEAVEILLEAGADVNARIHDYTPLHIATRRALTRIVELLLHKGADPGLRNHWHRTALDIAQEDGYTDIVAVFQRHEQQRQITSNGSLEVGSTMMDQEHYSYHRTG